MLFSVFSVGSVVNALYFDVAPEVAYSMVYVSLRLCGEGFSTLIHSVNSANRCRGLPAPLAPSLHYGMWQSDIRKYGAD